MVVGMLNRQSMLFKLREWQQSDLVSLVKYANNANIAKNMTNGFPHPYTLENGQNFLNMAITNNKTIKCIEINNEASGGIGLHLQNDIQCKNAELGYWLAEPFWGKGIVTDAIKQMVNYGFDNFDINRIYARPFGTNLASQKVLEKCGFTLEATLHQTLYKNDEYIDELIYAIRK